MFLLNNTNYKYSNSHFHAKAFTDFCESFSKKKRNRKTKKQNSAWILHVPAIEISVTQAQAFFDKYGSKKEYQSLFKH